MSGVTTEKLAIQGGPKAMQLGVADLFTWPIITPEDENAVLDVLRRGAMSGSDVTLKFEEELAAWHKMKYAVAQNNGTAALHAAMWACGVRRGDDVIGPSITYWASVLPALSLGATVTFADIDPRTLCIDPEDLARRITPRTKVIVVVHYLGHPCEMDPILALARSRGIKVIEDVSHAQGGLYKGRLLGTLGDVAAMSLMSGKALVSGEGGALLTNDRGLYQRAVAFGLYERTGGPSRYAQATADVSDEELKPFAGLPLGGHKYRLHQLSAALGRGQLRHYAGRITEIQAALNRFWDLLEGVPGLRAHRPAKDSGSTMGGWYAAHGLYVPEELHGLPVEKFCEAVRAEGVSDCHPGVNSPLHLHALFHEADIYGDGQPTNRANARGGSVQGRVSLPVSEAVAARSFSIPWFKHDRKTLIEAHAAAFRKVACAAKAGELKA